MILVWGSMIMGFFAQCSLRPHSQPNAIQPYLSRLVSAVTLSVKPSLTFCSRTERSSISVPRNFPHRPLSPFPLLCSEPLKGKPWDLHNCDPTGLAACWQVVGIQHPRSEQALEVTSHLIRERGFNDENKSHTGLCRTGPCDSRAGMLCKGFLPSVAG